MHKRTPFLILFALLSFPGGAYAQSDAYPAKPVRFVLSFPPGGTTDRIGRLLTERLQSALKQPFVIDHRPGAGGNIGSAIVAKAPPDGYTLLMGSAILAIGPSMYRNPGYDAQRDLAPISLVATIPTILVVHPSVPAKTLKELIDLARRNPGKLNFGTGGVGSSPHLAGELFKSLAKVNVIHVPYKSTATAMYGLITGETDFVMITPTAALPLIEQGKLRALAVLRKERVAVLPNLPTTAEGGLPGWVVNAWYGVLAPAGTPAPIVDRLNNALVKGLAAQDARDILTSVAAEPQTSTPAAFAEFLKAETARMGKIVRDAGIRID